MKRVVLFFFLSLGVLLFLSLKKHVFKYDDFHSIVVKKIPPLPKIDYYKILGKTPNQLELELGRNLFNDPILSRNNDVSCATCHLSNHGFADGMSLSVGALGHGGVDGDNVGLGFGEGKLAHTRSLGDDGFGFQGRDFMFRNSLSTVNVAYRASDLNESGLFWDGRFGKLDFQTLLPTHTKEEMCGTNPIVLLEGQNIFRFDGPIFRSKEVRITHTNGVDSYTGLDTESFNTGAKSIQGIPYLRPNATVSIPTRNECLALVIAKLRLIPYYESTFKKVYGSDGVTDKNLAMALASFISTHVSSRTPFDEFYQRKNSLTDNQIYGLASFMTPLNKTIKVSGKVIKGAGCISCHSGPEFGGKGFASLGVKSDVRSSLSQKKTIFAINSGFFGREQLVRGSFPRCHLNGVSAQDSVSYVPDIGRANGSFKEKDCFKFRVPPLRNVIETYPYFHHGTGRGQTKINEKMSLEEKSVVALKEVVKYHLRGPVDHTLTSRNNTSKAYTDEFWQKDFLVPYFAQNFLNTLDEVPKNLEYFPQEFTDQEVANIVDFIAYGLWDRQSSFRGDLGNIVSHPRTVPSGFSPSITRDQGHQLEIPPKAN